MIFGVYFEIVIVQYVKKREKLKNLIASFFKKLSKSGGNSTNFQSKCIKMESTCMNYYSTFIFANDKRMSFSFKLRCKVPIKGQKNYLLPNFPPKILPEKDFSHPLQIFHTP